MNSILTFFRPNIAYADDPGSIKIFVAKVDLYIVNPLIILMFAVALMFFLFGVLEFFINEASAGEKGTGKQHMLWGVVGMFLMISVFGILKLIQHTLGVPDNPLINN